MLIKALEILNKKPPEIKTYIDCLSSHRTIRLPGKTLSCDLIFLSCDLINILVM